MKIAMLSPLSWRTPPRHYGPWENVVSLLTEQLVSMGVDVTLFASGDSITKAKLSWVSRRAYSEDSNIDPKVWEGLHIAKLFERAEEFDLIHNHYDFLPLNYCHFTQIPILTTIHGFSSQAIVPVYKKYNDFSHYVATSEANKNKSLNYITTIHHGIDIRQFTFRRNSDGYLLYFARIHPEKGLHNAIRLARLVDRQLVIAGIVQDEIYFREKIEPYIDGTSIQYIGPVGPEQKPKILGGALALLHLIDYDEAFSLSVIEAQACGTPVIAYDRGSVAELIRHHKTGFIVSDLEAAIQATKNIGTLNRRDCRFEIEKNFTCERMAKDYLDVYHEILDQRENFRPWGHYENLHETDNHKVKELIVEPGERLSLQKHKRRAEHWTVVSGEALVTVNHDELALKQGMSVDIPRGAEHRITNPGDIPLVLVEVQMGDYFGEDDIVRLEDDYHRNS